MAVKKELNIDLANGEHCHEHEHCHEDECHSHAHCHPSEVSHTHEHLHEEGSGKAVGCSDDCEQPGTKKQG